MERVYKKTGFILYKLIPCLLVTMYAFMCLYGSSVYASNASDYPVIHNSTFNSLTNEYSNYFVLNRENGSFLAYFTNGNFYCITTNSTSGDMYSSDFSYVYYYNNNVTDWTQTPYSPITSDTILTTCTFEDIIVSSSDIPDKNGNVVFQAPPQQVEENKVLAPIVETQEMKPLQEIMGILPTVLVVIVGLLAIRKGIQFLMARMKKA